MKTDKKSFPYSLRVIVASISALAFSLAFPPFNFWYLAWVGLVPLLLVLGERTWQDFFLAWWAGLLFHTFLLSWLFRLAGPLYLLLTAYLGLYWAVFFGLFFRLPEKGRVFVGAGLWFFLEIITGHFLTGFPWLCFALSQTGNAYLLPLAGIFGAGVISFLVIQSNLTLFQCWRKKHLISTLISLGVIGGAWLTGRYVFQREPAADFLKLLVVQENISSGRDWQPEAVLGAYYSTTAEILKEEKVDVVIWPESVYSDVISDRPDILEKLALLTRKHRCGLIFGSITESSGQYYNSALFVTDKSIQIYRKTHLVPYGEFILGGRFSLVRNFYERVAGYVPYLKPGRDFTLFEWSGRSLAPLICFENIFPEICGRFADDNRGVFVVITNDSWFGKSFGPYQHFAHNILRAAETNRYFIQAAGTGISGIVSPEGAVQSIRRGKEQIFIKGHLLVLAPLLKRKTFYRVHGEFTLCFLILIGTGALLCKR